ncbi:MAG TPA: hypothetical protein VK926_01970 [Gaiellaceae bacterium]|nr:hypothetical protein [Gaiellaceae bacterium]
MRAERPPEEWLLKAHDGPILVDLIFRPAVLEPARALREQIDWDEVRLRSSSSPFGRAFFTFAESLDIVERENALLA